MKHFTERSDGGRCAESSGLTDTRSARKRAETLANAVELYGALAFREVGRSLSSACTALHKFPPPLVVGLRRAASQAYDKKNSERDFSMSIAPHRSSRRWASEDRPLAAVSYGSLYEEPCSGLCAVESAMVHFTGVRLPGSSECKP